MSITKHHAEWLSLIDISGPFLTVNRLQEVFPQGLDVLESERIQELRAAYEEWNAESDPRFHRAWVRYVLETLLEWDSRRLAEGQGIPEPFKYTASEHGGETIRPDYVLHEPGHPNHARVLVCIYPQGTPLEKPMTRAAWTASPAARTFALLRASGARLGLVTNGEQWMLVNAPATGLAGYVSWYAELWLEERLTLRAFVSLLCLRRFFGVADEDTLEAMLDASANDVQEVTDQLGIQVRHAVEILVRSIDRADQDCNGALLAGVSEGELYRAALTVMMRLVFLLSAEERGLFLLGDPIYDQFYAVSTLRAQLHENADRTGEDVLERRGDAWARLLATFRLVYHGATHEDLRLPAYGGSLFDPDQFPFLEGRVDGLDDTPPHVDNRTVLHLLDALQVLKTRGEPRRLSFRSLDIEQIGHVYEGLLDHETRRADEVMLGFSGSYEPEIGLSELQGNKDIQKFLKEATGRSSVSPIKRALESAPDPDRARRLRTVCRDEDIFNAALPFLNLLRDDEFGYPVVVLPGRAFVTAGTERRATGTHYTPRSLTEPVVRHTLEPLLYRGMAEGLPAEQWKLISPREILALKVCDMAMGSGAFLVQACRYLAEKLQEAWDGLTPPPNPLPVNGEGEPESTGADSSVRTSFMMSAAGMPLTVEGEKATGALGEILIPVDANERQTLALRLIADRCLYGVDKNPLAVEMAKLSLWLTTLAKGRPFTFLDHALKNGDSLVGVSLDQLRDWTLDPAESRDVPLFAARIRLQIDEVAGLRQKIEGFTVNTVHDQREKARLLREAEIKTHDLRMAGDLLLASYFNDYRAADQKAMRGHLLEVVQKGADVPEGYYAPIEAVGRVNPFHWELEFPEVFSNGRGGFDAFVGNPPFQGGSMITGTFGVPYRDYLVKFIANGQRGNADLSAYFFLRAYNFLRNAGSFGLISTNTIAQGDTRDVGLTQLDKLGGSIYRAYNDLMWPGVAAVAVNVVHIYKGNYHNIRYLDDEPVEFITPLLDDVAVNGRYLPYHLRANLNMSFNGTKVNGIGFVLSPEQAISLISRNQQNQDVLFPYLNGEDLNNTPDQSPTRWVINFFDWELEKAEQYYECMSIVRELVKPERDKLATGDATSRDRARRWWQFDRPTLDVYRAIASLKSVLVIAETTKYCVFAFLPINMVFSHMTKVIASDKSYMFALLSSNIHENWARKYSSTLETRLKYTPSDCFETFPFPSTENLASLENIGETYHETRRQIMLDRQEGLTATYNRFHNPDERSGDIQHLRDLHRGMDESVALAYGWDDLALDHDFHETAQGIRYTISEAARREVLRRLLALNFERYEEEQRMGVGAGKRGKKKNPSPPAPSPTRGEGVRAFESPARGEDDPNAIPPEQLSLFDDDLPKPRRLL